MHIFRPWMNGSKNFLSMAHAPSVPSLLSLIVWINKAVAIKERCPSNKGFWFCLLPTVQRNFDGTQKIELRTSQSDESGVEPDDPYQNYFNRSNHPDAPSSPPEKNTESVPWLHETLKGARVGLGVFFGFILATAAQQKGLVRTAQNK